MARPERNDIDYFPHSVNHGKKMFYLDENYGNDGYSVWFRTLEELGKANYHYLDFRDETQLMFMSSRCKVSEEIYLEIIGVLVKFGEFDKNLWDQYQIMWNQKYVDSIKDAYIKRVNTCVTLSELLAKLQLPVPETHKEPPNPVPETHKEVANPGEKGTGNPQSRVEYSKVKDSKEENTIKLMSDLDGLTTLNEYEKIAFSFWELIGENMKRFGINSSDITKAKYKKWVDPVRLAMQVDKRTREEFAEIFNFLQSEVPKNGFSWAQNIRSTGKLREKFEAVLIKAKGPGTGPSNTERLLNEIQNG